MEIDEKEVLEPASFCTSFERAKMMRSEVIVESGIIENLAARALDIIPAKCHRSTIYIVTDSVTNDLYGEVMLDGLLSAGLNAKKLVMQSHTDASSNGATS